MLLMPILFLASIQDADTGEWGFEYNGKNCLLGRLDKQGGIIFDEGGGGNVSIYARDGGPEIIWKDYTIELVLEGKSMGTFTASGEMRPYFGPTAVTAYNAYLPLDRFADKERLGTGEIRRDGRTILTFPLKGLKTAIAQLHQCNKEAAAENAKKEK
ncbi:MAG: hypothetical protein ACTHJR_16635 [Sphingomonas sp.]|uniref:hypothetical protein n=1 Tax=Sphingomonas sp. TaxID=28214 RepID=UPI003F81991F